MSRPKLLLADDSVTIQKVVNLTFAERGMDVIAFSDGEAALGHFDEVRPDIVLADVNMPAINGYQLCELLRTDNANRDLPVVLLVGSFEPFDRDEAQRVGANTHLTKPFTSIAELISTVDGLLAKPELTADEQSTKSEPLAGERVSDADIPRVQHDTSDIDILYEQSFAETVEIPRESGAEYELAGIDDDEMIQTSYGEPDLPAIEESSYYAANASEEFTELQVPTANDLDHEPDVDGEQAYGSFSLDVPAEMPVQQPAPTDVSPTNESFDLADVASDKGEGTELAESLESPQEVRVYDPFDSLAAEPPSLEEAGKTYNAVKYSFEEADLLDLPPLEMPKPVVYTVPKAPAADKEVVSISPELVEMIVEKVMERLGQKQ